MWLESGSPVFCRRQADLFGFVSLRPEVATKTLDDGFPVPLYLTRDSGWIKFGIWDWDSDRAGMPRRWSLFVAALFKSKFLRPEVNKGAESRCL